jgi:hypothetical protein
MVCRLPDLDPGLAPVAKGLVMMKRTLPDRAHDAFLRRQYGLPR